MFRSYKRAISFLIALPFILTVSALSEPAPEYDEYEQSRGESWDERYGEGEVAGDYMGSWTVAFCDEWVSLRARPDKNSERLLKVPKWADVEAYYYDGNWFECIYNGQRGYISRDYLTDRPGKFPDYPGNEDYQNNDIHSEYTDDSIAGYDTDYYTGTWEAGNYPDEYVDDWQLDYIGEYYVVNCNEWVSLWEHADDTSTRLKQVPLGALVMDCYDTVFDYYLCMYDGAYGFIRKQYLSPEPAVQDESWQQGEQSYDPVKPGNFFYVWNEYSEMNLYGGDQPSLANFDWRNGYEVLENFAGSFNNGVSMGYLGNRFGDGLQNPKKWLMEVERHENGGENTILSYIARNMQQSDTVEVVDSELYAWRLGSYEGADTLSEEEFYEFLVTMNSLGTQYDIMIDMTATFDEGDYIQSLLLGEYPFSSNSTSVSPFQFESDNSDSQLGSSRIEPESKVDNTDTGEFFDYGTVKVFLWNLPERRRDLSVMVVWNKPELSNGLLKYLNSDRWAKFNVDMSYERWDESDLHWEYDVYSDLDDILRVELSEGNLSYQGMDVLFVFGAEPEHMGQTIEICQIKGIGIYISSSTDALMAYETICDKTTGL